VTPFYQTLTQDNVIQTAWAKIYQGNRPTGTPLLEMGASLPGHGYTAGSVTHSGDTVTSFNALQMSVVSDSDFYVDGYIGATDVELRAENFEWYAVVPTPFPFLHLDPSTGDFFGGSLVYVALGTRMSIRLGDLITYELPAEAQDYYLSLHGMITGHVAMAGGVPTVSAAILGSTWQDLGFLFPGLDYTLEVGFNLDPKVPEPCALSVLALGGLALLRRRR
jgi:hypothetical protein